MNNLKKAFAVFVAGASFVAAASSASAQTSFVPGQAVQATGTLNQSLLGSNLTICQVTFHGTVTGSGTTATGFKFDSYEGTQVGGSGNLACDDSIDFGPNDLVVTGDLATATTLNLEHILVSTRLGSCEATNVTLNWGNPVVTFPVGTIFPPVCQFDGSLTVSAE